ncbi:MAG: PAS domain-containing protein, partial [Deltaproteobacteria bacterium]|nr:PAS domain-containing protein [Deltaproteobacteria bacterium]
KIVASIPSSLLVLDRNLNIKSVNRTYRETRGIKDEDVVGKNIKEVFPHHILKEGGLLKAFEEVLATKEPCSLYEVKHTSSDHPEKILNITVSGLRRAEEEKEEEATLIVVIDDITERARLREELQKKNKELENFVYIVSHNLKSPIVSMQGFSSMLLNEYREKLGTEGERYLDRIRANASRMEVLISDLLALSRVGRVVGTFKDVSSLDIVKRVCKRIKGRMEEKGTEVSAYGGKRDRGLHKR